MEQREGLFDDVAELAQALERGRGMVEGLVHVALKGDVVVMCDAPIDRLALVAVVGAGLALVIGGVQLAFTP
ncbi:hypothetical protein ACH4VM_04495 [Streptomyces sp. NPDC020792]|uniref:hypothetical protein n=1 Tax=Streptomyces sp. NPDC020792 TaxID=3365089 RepID=UPI0037957A12